MELDNSTIFNICHHSPINFRRHFNFSNCEKHRKHQTGEVKKYLERKKTINYKQNYNDTESFALITKVAKTPG